MSQSYVKLYVHVVFHTKNNIGFIKETKADELYSYLGGILKNLNSIPIQIGGTSDHVHVLCTLSKTMSLADLMEEIKRSSSKWIKTKDETFKNFYWQDGYGGFTVGWSQLEQVKSYIINQEQHHQKTGFEEEYRNLLKDNGIEFDERYL
jgi:putative transposase